VGVVGIIPYKGVFTSKTRLARIMNDEERIRFSLSMLEEAMKAMAGAGVLRGRILLGGDQFSRNLAQKYGFQIMPDRKKGLNENLIYALTELGKRGVEKTLIIPGDLPLIKVSSLKWMLHLGKRYQVVISPSRNREGTNGLFIPTGFKGDLQFGPNSFLRHFHAFRQRTSSIAVLVCRQLSLDIDTPEEYFWLESLVQEGSYRC
jgi:2-phospho-L-lactate guanylyltransferase